MGICVDCMGSEQFAERQFAERQFAETQFAEREGQFDEIYSANCPFELTEFCRDNLPNT